MGELKERLRKVIADYKLLISSRKKRVPAPSNNNRHAVIVHYASWLCVFIRRFCEANNEFARGKITAEQRDTIQQNQLEQIASWLVKAQAAFEQVVSKESSEASRKKLKAPPTQVSYNSKDYANPNEVLKAMQAEAAALVVGNTCACSLCPTMQLLPPKPLKAGDVITFKAAFQGSKKRGVDFFNQLEEEIKKSKVEIRAEDLEDYNAEITNIARFLAANPSSTISITVGSDGSSSEPDNIDKLRTLIAARAKKVKEDFISAGIPATKIAVIELSPAQPNLDITVNIK